jgi:hypothetical protein
MEELDRVVFGSGEQVISVQALENYEAMIDGVSVKLVKGKESKVPVWVGQVLILNKKAEMLSEDIISVPELNRVVRQEGSFALQKIDELLFIKARQEMTRLSRKTDQLAYRNRLSIRGLYEELVRKRLGKILKIAEKGDTAASTIKNLVPEEEWLYHQIEMIVSNWKESLGKQSTPLYQN